MAKGSEPASKGDGTQHGNRSGSGNECSLPFRLETLEANAANSASRYHQAGEEAIAVAATGPRLRWS